MSVYIRKFRSYLRQHETAKGLLLVGIVILGAIGIWGGIRFALNTEFPVLVVSSGSMCQRLSNPSTTLCTLDIGDLIVIRGENPTSIVAGQPPVGSIIVFRPPPAFSPDPNYLVVHRVIRIVQMSDGAHFLTKGDANGGEDPWNSSPYNGVSGSRVVGVYQLTVPGSPYLGSIILAIRGFMYNDTTGQPKPQGIAVIVALIAALIAFEILEPSKKKKTSAATPPAPTVQPQPEKPTEPEVQPGPEGS